MSEHYELLHWIGGTQSGWDFVAQLFNSFKYHGGEGQYKKEMPEAAKSPSVDQTETSSWWSNFTFSVLIQVQDMAHNFCPLEFLSCVFQDTACFCVSTVLENESNFCQNYCPFIFCRIKPIFVTAYFFLRHPDSCFDRRKLL